MEPTPTPKHKPKHKHKHKHKPTVWERQQIWRDLRSAALLPQIPR